MTQFLKLAALLSLAVLPNFITYSAPKKESCGFAASSSQTGYKAEFLSNYREAVKKCSAQERQIINALISSDIQSVKKLITTKNANKQFTAHLTGITGWGRIRVNTNSLLKIPYITIATEAYLLAPHKKAKDQALLVIQELLKLGANPNSARIVNAVLTGTGRDSHNKGTTHAVIPTISLSIDDPVLFELFLKHKGDLTVRMSTASNSNMPKTKASSVSYTINQLLRDTKNPKIKALAHKYGHKK